MGSIRVKYLHKRRYKGQDLLYWYPKKEYLVGGEWVKCPFEGGEIKSIAEAEDLNAQLKEWRNSAVKYKQLYAHGTVGWLIAQYKKSPRYDELAPNTKKLYNWHFPEIERVFGDRLAKIITRQHAAAFYHSFSAHKHKASKMVQVARIIFAFGRDIGIFNENPFEKLRVRKGDSRETVWTTEMLELAKAKAVQMGMSSIALAIQMGMDTGQRPGDLRLLTWNRYNGLTIKLRQTKTKAWVEVPIMAELRTMLNKADKTSPVILITEATGKPYTKDMLSHRIRDVLRAAEIPDHIQFRDLRRTAVVRLAEHGCDIPEICAITGHRLSDATQILEVYLPRNSKMAANAIAKLERKEQ